MKKLFLLFFALCLTHSLWAAHTQFAIFAMGKDAKLKVTDRGVVSIRTKTQLDRKTGAQRYTCLYFNLSSRTYKETKNFSFKIEADNSDLQVYIGHKRADKMMWTSLKLDGKEQIKDPKKGELIGMKNFKIGKIDKKKTITVEGTYRAPSRKELQADKKVAKKSPKKSAKKSSKKSSKK